MVDSLITGNHYPLFKATIVPKDVVVVYGPYVIFSKIQGFVPAIDITGGCDEMYTFIVNQMSVGKALFQRWLKPVEGAKEDAKLSEATLRISRVAEGRMAPYKIEVS